MLDRDDILEKGREALNALQKQLSQHFCDKSLLKMSKKTPKPSTIEAFFKHYSLGDVLCYQYFDEETDLYVNKKSEGFILSFSPLVGIDETMIEGLEAILVHSVPENADVQFLLYASPTIGPRLKAYQLLRTQSPETFQWLAQKRCAYLATGAFAPLLKASPVVLRDFRAFFVVSMRRNTESSELLMRARTDIQAQLEALDIESERLAVNDFITLLRELLCPKAQIDRAQARWSPLDELAVQVTDDSCRITIEKDHIRFAYPNENDTVAMRAYSVKQFPDRLAGWQMVDSIGHLFRPLEQLTSPFVVSLNLRRLPNEMAQAKTTYHSLRKEKKNQGDSKKLLSSLSREEEDWRVFKRRLDEGEHAVQAFYQVIVLGKPETLNRAESQLMQLYRAQGWQLQQHIGMQWQSFLALMPMMMSEGMWKELKSFKRLRTMTTFNAINMAPLQGDYPGTGTPRNLYITRRGQVAFHDTYDYRDGNFNVAVIAPPGRGKSVWAQEQIVSLLSQGGRAWVIDAGRSYEKICQLLGGTFIEFPENQPININPFTHVRDILASMSTLKNLVGAMARPSGRITDEEYSFIEQAIRASWEKEKNNTTITALSAWLDKQESPICKTLVTLLYPYTKAGSYAQYFEGKSCLDLDKAFVVLELDDLKNKKQLRKIILMVLMASITEHMYLGNRNLPKACIIDEAWDLMGDGGSEGAASFIEAGYRTARRYFGAFIAITQDIDDFFASRMAQAAYSFSDFKIIFAQNPESLAQAKKNKQLVMDEFEERLFKSLRSVKGDYSEFVLKTPYGIEVYRLVLDPFSLVLYSSKAEEFQAIKDLLAQGWVLSDAIEHVAQHYYPEKCQRLGEALS